MLTNLCKVVLAVSLLMVGVVGCGDDSSPATTMDLSAPSGADLSHGAVADLAMPGDDGGTGLKALCATCAQDSECASGSCIAYMGGNSKKCSHSCAMATAATDCPGIGMCSGMNVCKCQ